MSKLHNMGYDKGYREYETPVFVGDGLPRELLHILLLYTSKKYRDGYFLGCEIGEEVRAAIFRAEFEALCPNALLSGPWLERIESELTMPL